MMYINRYAVDNNYGNPRSFRSGEDLILPESLLTSYISAKGYVNISIEGDTVVALTKNVEAYNEYVNTHAENPEEPSQLDRIEAQVMYTALMTDTLLEE